MYTWKIKFGEEMGTHQQSKNVGPYNHLEDSSCKCNLKTPTESWYFNNVWQTLAETKLFTCTWLTYIWKVGYATGESK